MNQISPTKSAVIAKHVAAAQAKQRPPSPGETFSLEVQWDSGHSRCSTCYSGKHRPRTDPKRHCRTCPRVRSESSSCSWHGGPSHVDTFDYKPLLRRDHGKPLPFDKPRVQFAKTGNLLRSPWKFRQYGESGAWVSDLFPHVAGHVDDLTFVKSMHGSNEAHGGAMLKVHTGSDTFVRPSMGSWISYGLGSENDNLPSFVTIRPTLGHGGVKNFGSAFLPAQHQATRIGSSNGKMKDAVIENLSNPRLKKKSIAAADGFGTNLEPVASGTVRC